ncbi:hypothetical protein EMCRGX_G001698 [Ephydatia muelleri]
MPAVSGKQKSATCGSTAPVGMADAALVATSYRFCWSLPGEDVRRAGGRPLKVAGGRSPAELLLGRKPRTPLDLLHPGNSPTEPQSTETPQEVRATVAKNQQRQKVSHDKRAKQRLFHVGQSVYVKNFRGPPNWLPGVVTAILAPLTFEVNVGSGNTVRRHIDHIRSRIDGASHSRSSMSTDAASPAVGKSTETEVPRTPREEGVSDQLETPSRGRGEVGVANTGEELPMEPAEGIVHQGSEPLQLAHSNAQDSSVSGEATSETTEQATAEIAKPQQEVRRSSRARVPPNRFGWKLRPRREECSDPT